jgi:AcrR family transcriptional regulator
VVRNIRAVTFQRARSEEQREVRRRAILSTAAAMLAEMPVAALSLNELSRRVGLAKSNVLRYFETREAVLLELLDQAWREWLDALADELVPDPAAPVAERVERVAEVLSRTLVARPMLCELGSASGAVLERNVSAAVAVRFKRATLADTDALGRAVHTVLPELTDLAGVRFAMTTVLVAGALWAHSRPSPTMLAVYDADPALAVLRPDFGATLRELLATLLSGLIARPPG